MRRLSRLTALLLAAVFLFAGGALADSITLPADLEAIEAEAFAGCESLSGVLYIPAEIEVDETAFDNTPNLTVTRSPWRVAVIGDSETPWDVSLNNDVWSAVSDFCGARDVPCVYRTSVAGAVSEGCNVVITVGFLTSMDVTEAQTAYPDVRFICLDAEVDSQQNNVYAVQYRADQAGFMAGYAAVKMGYRALGFMGGISDVPDVVSYGQGFVRGANQAAVELDIADYVTVAYTYTESFAPNQLAYQTAKSWYQAGTEIIFCAGGDQGESVVQAAAEQGGRMIGVDTDQRRLYGGNVVTSAMKNLGYTAADALSRILSGGWDAIGGTSPRLGVISSSPANNHVCLAATTQFGGDFSSADYSSMVGKLYGGEYSASGAYQIAVNSSPVLPDVTVSSAAKLRAMGSPLRGTIRVVSDNNAPVDLTWPVTLNGELRVETGSNQFSSLRICEGGSLTLAQGSVAGSYSGWDPVYGGPTSVAQIWVEGGTLDASQGEIVGYSTVFIRGGTYIEPTGEGSDDVYVIGGALSEAMLQGFLADPRVDEVFIQENMTLTEDIDLSVSMQIMEGNEGMHPAVTIGSGVTVIVRSGATLSINNGCVLTVAAGGKLCVENGGNVFGDVQVQDGGFYGELIKVAVVGDEADLTKETLNRDVWSAVSAFCENRDIACVYKTDVASALGEGCNVVITVGFMASMDVTEAQTAYPDVRFICLDTDVESQQDNVYAVQYRADQAGFMAGYAAVKMGYRALGFMGGMSEVADVVSYGQGFLRGANQAAAELVAAELLDAADDVTVAYAYTGTFGPEDSVYNLAAGWYGSGVEIIFCAGGNQGERVAEAANALNGKMIGVDTDQRYTYGSGNIVTSAMKNLGYTATDALSRILSGGWDAIGGTCPRLGVVSATPADNHVRLAPSTQFGGDFSGADYAAMVAKLLSGEYSASGELQIAVHDGPVQP